MLMSPDWGFILHRFGDEANDNARVWRLYHDRADEQDQDRLAGWHDTLNILLIFVSKDDFFTVNHN